MPIIIGLLIAGIMIRVKINGMATYRAILFLPQILSMIVVGIAWRWIYAPKGPLNSGLDFFGLEEVSRAWLGSFDYALPFVGLIGTCVDKIVYDGEWVKVKWGPIRECNFYGNL